MSGEAMRVFCVPQSSPPVIGDILYFADFGSRVLMFLTAWSESIIVKFGHIIGVQPGKLPEKRQVRRGAYAIPE